MVKIKEFYITFIDTDKRDPNAYVEDTRKIAVENILSSIHYNLGTDFKTAGKLTTFSLWLVRNVPGESDGDLENEVGPNYRYGHFFKLDGSGEGYDEKMFCPKSK
jgi:hypothetical protein